MDFQLLEWDSDFFGVSVACITTPNSSRDTLRAMLSKLKELGVKLVYWPSDRECDDWEIARLNGRMVDLKTTFVTSFANSIREEVESDDLVSAYSLERPGKEVEDLAVQSGEYSRFSVDPNIPRAKFIELYKIWIRRSINKEIANEVLAIHEAGHIAGLVTLGDKNNRGDIGLIAVGANHRGKKYGEKLVRSAQRWFVTNGYDVGQVVTQGTNLPACRLYKKCGYVVEKVEYYYHFWL